MLASDDEIRKQNRAVVEDYMSRRGAGRLTRYQLFTEDGTGGLYTADTKEPVITGGHAGLKAHGEWSLKMFPDWVWFNVEIYETQDPNRFWVECDGAGQILFPDYPPGRYENHFIHAFKFRDGRIAEQREFMNPFQQLRALGIEVPVVRRGGIPR
ncbi:PhzA/PhzB family protein [Dactylosporangium sp. CA-139066]|uniref:PhzA/PhzB family protein n=1 Tax=Dactylosporangium sp. CA-139066 TaxID=3239930 RepID=UPI003D916E1E